MLVVFLLLLLVVRLFVLRVYIYIYIYMSDVGVEWATYNNALHNTRRRATVQLHILEYGALRWASQWMSQLHHRII